MRLSMEEKGRKRGVNVTNEPYYFTFLDYSMVYMIMKKEFSALKYPINFKLWKPAK